MPLNDEGLDYVQQVIENNILSDEDFNYSIRVNQSPFAYWRNAKDEKVFEQFRKGLDSSTRSIEVTFKFGKSKGGTRVVLRDPSLAGTDFDPAETVGRNQYTNSQQRSREQDIEERATLRVEKKMLEKEAEHLKRENESLRDKLEEAKQFTDEVDKLIERLKERGRQAKDPDILEQIGDFVSKIATIAPGLLKNNPLGELLGIGAPQNLGDAPESLAGGTTITPKGAPPHPSDDPQPQAQQFDEETLDLAVTMRELKKHFSQYELQDCFKLLSLLAACKMLIPVLLDIAREEVEQQQARQRSKREKQQQQQPPASDSGGGGET